MPTHLVLFDIDGTLLVTAGAGRRAITQALREHVQDAAAFDRISFGGKTDPQIVRELLLDAGHPAADDQDLIGRVCRDYVTFLEVELQQPGTRVTLMPGVLPLLERLEQESQVVLGLLTGNVREGARLKLKRGGIEPEIFRVGAFGSDSGHRPDLPAIAAQRAAGHFGEPPSGHRVVIIGDTPADMTCGIGIGARAVGVATGSFSLAALESAGAHAAFSDLSDTERVVEALLG
jgi:phosphoglycolate phosphatase-like HAD superfamily hydrolase